MLCSQQRLTTHSGCVLHDMPRSRLVQQQFFHGIQWSVADTIRSIQAHCKREHRGQQKQRLSPNIKWHFQGEYCLLTQAAYCEAASFAAFGPHRLISHLEEHAEYVVLIGVRLDKVKLLTHSLNWGSSFKVVTNKDGTGKVLSSSAIWPHGIVVRPFWEAPFRKSLIKSLTTGLYSGSDSMCLAD